MWAGRERAHTRVYMCTCISASPSEERDSVLIFGKLHESPYHYSDVEFAQRPAEAAVKPTKYRDRRSRQLEVQQMLAKMIQ